MKLHRTISIALMMTAGVLLSGCEKEEDIKLASAQECIDYARTESEADRCYALVSGIESEKAYLIRCSSHYIAQGFTGSRFASAFQRLKDNPTSGQDPMATAMAYLIFARTSTLHTADNAVADCNRSGVRSMKRLATLTKLATVVATAGLGSIPTTANPESGSFDVTQITTAINTLVGSGSAADKENIGNIAVQANEAYCNTGSSFESNEICVNLRAAVNNNTTAQAIGNTLLQYLQHVH